MTCVAWNHKFCKELNENKIDSYCFSCGLELKEAEIGSHVLTCFLEKTSVASYCSYCGDVYSDSTDLWTCPDCNESEPYVKKFWGFVKQDPKHLCLKGFVYFENI